MSSGCEESSGCENFPDFVAARRIDGSGRNAWLSESACNNRVISSLESTGRMNVEHCGCGRIYRFAV